MASTTVLPAEALPCLIAYIYKRWTRLSFSDIPGPKADSFLLGNLSELFVGPAAEADFKWKEAFGSVVRYKGILGDDHLMISDPKALQYILHTSAYHFLKETGGRRAISHLLNGHSLNSVDGDIHKRHRKVMIPAFGAPEARALFPAFRKMSQELMARWKDITTQDFESGSIVFNIPRWLSRATLDAIGEAAFDYQFGALNNSQTELGKAYENVNAALFGIPTSSRVFWDNFIDWLPSWLVEKLMTVLPNKRYKKIRYTSDVSTRVAKQLVREKRNAVGLGKENKDVMSLLVRANASTDPKAQLSDEELYAEMRIILFAGHETTSNTLTWTLWELAKHPDFQTQLRNEIRATEAKTESELTLADMERMPYLQAVLKEGLRFHPAISRLMRLVKDDEVIPLSKPFTTISGAVRSELAISAGTKIMLALAAYNRDKEICGPDADTFNPGRWLSGNDRNKEHTSIGVVGNTYVISITLFRRFTARECSMTFSSGTRSCIGWRFAMAEMQCFLVDLINNFEFSPTEDEKRIRREGPALMFPVVEGEIEDGVKLPLRVSIAARD
ncbi:cytochrome P450 [Neolentinus lepideus HHB14362 ss-1]|uniref:Cytochrome P450 n=1 Tax=Neolentinus lepideus HHB14362 ss-1 TaxID=1314782 RepID=A0A165TTW9_9AGAM|nr:cytochrome P450 [Neolentinus lepideus HHB14362 ss-1]